MVELDQFAKDFASALKEADRTCPAATNVRSKVEFARGIGPHAESSAVKFVMNELAKRSPMLYGNFSVSVAYPSAKRKKCDLCLGSAPSWDWCMEVKLARLLGDNGKPNDNILMHILSPYGLPHERWARRFS